MERLSFRPTRSIFAHWSQTKHTGIESRQTQQGQKTTEEAAGIEKRDGDGDGDREGDGEGEGDGDRDDAPCLLHKP